MSYLPRIIPAVLAVISLVGCFLPFSGGSGQAVVNLLSFPDVVTQANGVIGMFNGPPRGVGAPYNPTASIWLARLVYLAPLMSVLILVLSLRGLVGRFLQIVVGSVWMLVPVLIPYFVGILLIESNPMLKQMAQSFGQSSSPSISFEVGGWILIFCAIGMFLSAFGLLKISLSTHQE